LIFFAVLGTALWTPAAAALLKSVRIDVAPETLFLFALPFLIPPAFIVTRDLRSDKFLGDLCYPIYLVHVTVIIWVRTFSGAAVPLSTGQLWAIDGLVILVALIIYAICDRPMDRVRKLRFSRSVRGGMTASDGESAPGAVPAVSNLPA
jgi:peptidoglycan/LPS O-acetylase OafA/YrhL